MYIQITTKCNMRCKHCCYACTPGKGKNMPADIFKAACELATNYEDMIAIGGGEPTLHPDLLWYIGYALLLSPTEYKPFMVTNGTVDEKTWRVLMRAKRAGNLELHVSKDPWHDEDKVQPWVWDDADRYNLWWGESGTRTIEPAGRAARHVEALRQDALQYGYQQVRVDPLSCADVRVDPSGTIYADVPRNLGGGKVGPLGEESYARAREILQEAEERGVVTNPLHDLRHGQ